MESLVTIELGSKGPVVIPEQIRLCLELKEWTPFGRRAAR